LQFVCVEMLKDDEIRTVENTVENVPYIVFGVWIEQRLYCTVHYLSMYLR